MLLCGRAFALPHRYSACNSCFVENPQRQNCQGASNFAAMPAKSFPAFIMQNINAAQLRSLNFHASKSIFFLSGGLTKELMSKAFIFSACLLFLFCSTNKSQNSINSLLNTPLNLSSKLKAVSLVNELFDEKDTIQLELTKDAVIGEINKIALCDSFIAVLDYEQARKLFLFSLQGKFIRQIGKLGKGPQEYAMPTGAFPICGHQLTSFPFTTAVVAKWKRSFQRPAL
jgi:hypothetical protein